MNLSINDLALIYPEQVFLEFSQSEREKAWQETQNHNYSNATARWISYINLLCTNTFFQYLQSEADIQTNNYRIWQENDLPSIWNLVNGTALELNSTRVILVPHEENDISELRVPKEWIDLPQWVGNYYLAVEINVEQCWLRICGYSTHQQLKEVGKHDFTDETYSLAVEELTEDLTTMLAGIELFSIQKPVVEVLPVLSEAEINYLLKVLEQSNLYSPRLELPFTQWGALINEHRLRKRLYQPQQAENAVTQITQLITDTTINLGQWFDSVFEAGWQSLDALINPQVGNLAFAFRQGNTNRELTVEAAKIIDLGIQLGNQSVALLIGLTRENDDKIGVRIQLHPASEQNYLPTKIKLALFSRSGKTLQQLESRTQDNLIQLKRFTCPIGKKFSIQVSLNDFSITENFVITMPVNHE
ncbi:Protein of unknown function (DUF1822) [Rivularia sp. PCC 7116]|uniref:DUF1822 family protein n=1 Tax=Rivularia sp. PCC 7116 TaxID=373994 RepID=UPI00029F1E7D|nr:DUF1822 family protein [Rivularia sp. PCC 7116]AFY54225.1 Protein of unknown function (DUF1822) [Rivularia sp. PCC 7116]